MKYDQQPGVNESIWYQAEYFLMAKCCNQTASPVALAEYLSETLGKLYPCYLMKVRAASLFDVLATHPQGLFVMSTPDKVTMLLLATVVYGAESTVE